MKFVNGGSGVRAIYQGEVNEKMNVSGIMSLGAGLFERRLGDERYCPSQMRSRYIFKTRIRKHCKPRETEKTRSKTIKSVRESL
jgi:hypothetical protein